MSEVNDDCILSEKVKDILASKIKDMEFVESTETLQAYRCCKCNNVAIRIRVAKCEHVFCNKCCRILTRRPCPVCKKCITVNPKKEEFMKSVFRLKVACQFKQEGCENVTALKDFLVHASVCRFSPKLPSRKVRQANPKYETLPLSQLSTPEIQSEKLLREEIKTQDKETDLFKKFIDGLFEKPSFREGVQNQFTMWLTSIAFKEGLNSSIKTEIQEVSNEMQISKYNVLAENNEKSVVPKDGKSRPDYGFLSLVHRPKTGNETRPRNLDDNQGPNTTFNWAITDIKKKMENCKIQTLHNKNAFFAASEEYSIFTQGLKFRADLLMIDHAMHINLHFTRESTKTSSTILQSRKYVLVDQNNSTCALKRHVVILNQPFYGEQRKQLKKRKYDSIHPFFPIGILQNDNRYVNNDAILIRIIFAPIAMIYKQIASMDGTLLIRIDNYWKRKHDAIDGIKLCLTSDSFYTSDTGFLVDMEIFLNGCSSNVEGITMHPKFRIGEFDDLHVTCTSIMYRYERIVMDQSDAQTKINCSLENELCEYNINGEHNQFNDFVFHKQVEKPRFLKDDSLLMKFIVQIK